MQPTRDRSTPDPTELARPSRARTRGRAGSSPGRSDRSGPLPQFSLPPGDADDAIDPDKTLEPLPAWGRTRAASVSNETSNEIDAVDILEEVPVRRRGSPHLARPASATQDVQIRDILEVMNIGVPLRRAPSFAPTPVAPRPAPPLPVPVPAARATEPSVPPTTPRLPADSSLSIEWAAPEGPSRLRARSRLVVASIAAVVIGVLGYAVLHRGESPASASTRAMPASGQAPAESGRARAMGSVPPPAPEGPEEGKRQGDIPMVSVDSLPRPSTGTVIGSPGHRLFIDGVVARGYSAVVRCGPHVVRVGSAGKVRSVDVPCGAELNVR